MAGFGRVVLALQLAAGLLVTVMFLVLGITGERDGGADRTWLDRAFPFAVALVALVVTAVVTWRGLRAARPPHPVPVRPAPRGPRPEHTARSAAPPEPTPAGRAELTRILGVLDRAGVLRPRAPAPEDLAAGVADHGETMTAFDVLAAMGEADTVRPGFRLDDHTDRLAFHATQVEQGEDTLRAQIADLDRLAGAELAVSADDVTIDRTSSGRAPTRLRLSLDGRARTVEYDGAVKYLSTVVHRTVASALRDAGATVRLAALGSDAGVWIAALPASSDLDRLNAELRAPDQERWEWIDEQEPHAAGDSPGMAP